MVDKMYKGEGGHYFSPRGVASGAALVRKAGGDSSFPASADKEISLIRQGRTSLGSSIPSYKKGGKVKKTGLALVHKGEKVIPSHAKALMKAKC